MLYNGSVTSLTALHEGIFKPTRKPEGRWMKMSHWALWNHMQKKAMCMLLLQIILVSSSLVSVCDCTAIFLNSWEICEWAWVGAGALCPQAGSDCCAPAEAAAGCGSRAPPGWNEQFFITHINREAPWQCDSLKNIARWKFSCTALCS